MTRQEAQKLATDLVNKMTLEEMVSQLRFDAPGIHRLNVPEYNWCSGFRYYGRSVRGVFSR